MSRILRRPMFRGGRVSSYGTGITSGLADGGMPDKRGLVTGPGGYQGRGKRIPQQYKEKILSPSYFGQGTGRYGLQGIGGPMFTGQQIMDFQTGYPKLGTTYAHNLAPSATYAYEAMNDEMRSIMQNMLDPETMLIDPDKIDVETGEVIEEEKIDTPDYETGEHWDIKPGEGDSYVPPGVKIDPGEVVIEEDSGIEAMADKYFALMGGDKAWQRDATDMLMSAGSKWLKEGATVRSGASEFLAEEAAKGPGRAETIRKAATKMAITQDVQMDFLQKKLDSAESIAEKNIIAQKIRDLNKTYAKGITQKDIEYGSSLKKGSAEHTMYLRKNKLSPTLATEATARVTDPTNLSGAMTVSEANALGPVYYSNWQGIFNPETSKADGTYLDEKEKKIIKFEGGELISSENIEIQ